MIDEDFIDLFNNDYLIFSNKSFINKYENDDLIFKKLIPVYNNKYDILFVHDFTIDNKDIVFNKYYKRIERFNNIIKDKNNEIIFVYCNYNNEYKKNIYKYWNEYFETNLFNNYINEIFIDTSIEKLKELLIKKYGNESITFMEENLL
jgi:hypothetical protein